MNMHKKSILTSILVLSLIVLFGTCVLGENYSSTLEVSSSYLGIGRYYSGSTISCNCTQTYLSTVFNTTSDSLTIYCQKSGFLGIYYTIGVPVTGTANIYGYSTVSGEWNMDGNGTYRFKFVKGKWWGIQEKIVSEDVGMWSD
jgi:hypothetical protein